MKIDLIGRMHEKPTMLNAVLLSIFACVITFQPFYLRSGINISEMSLYLPGINGILHGLVPFRDFFHLRGPLDLYIPALLMLIFGVKVSVLMTYFYVGNIASIITAILIGKEIFKTKYFLILSSFIIISRTFPRVMFSSWGGFRYAFGLMAILFAIYFFKNKKEIFIVLAGIFTALSGLVSIEMGVCSFLGVSAGLIGYIVSKDSKKMTSFIYYIIGILLIILPIFAYFLSVKALFPYFYSTWTVVTQMENIINLRVFSDIPKTFFDVLKIMFMPLSKNFRHVTPAYLYLIFAMVLLYKGLYRKDNNKINMNIPVEVICIAVYGFVIFATSFRNIWGSQFEMALQPEKLLLFFMLERAYMFLKSEMISSGKILSAKQMFRKNILVERIKFYGIIFLLVGLFMSTFGYSFMRFDRRFVAYQIVRNILFGKKIKDLQPFDGDNIKQIDIDRAENIVARKGQAEEIEGIVSFVQKNVPSDKPVLVYPDQGAYNFLFDRSFIGKFPVAAFSWFKDSWHKQFIRDFKKDMPEYVIFPDKLDIVAYRDYFSNAKNRIKYNEFMQIIEENYRYYFNEKNSKLYKLVKKDRK